MTRRLERGVWCCFLFYFLIRFKKIVEILGRRVNGGIFLGDFFYYYFGNYA